MVNFHFQTFVNFVNSAYSWLFLYGGGGGSTASIFVGLHIHGTIFFKAFHLDGYLLEVLYSHLFFYRYLAIATPLSHISCSRKNFFTLLCCLWIPGLFPTVFTLYSNTIEATARMNITTETLTYPYPVRLNEWITLVGGYFCPYVITISTTFAMLSKYQKMLQKRNCSVSSAVFDLNRKKKDAKFVRMVVMIFFGYTITCIPYTIQLGYFVTRNARVDFTGVIFTWPGTLLLCNGIVDVLVYSILDKSFRADISNFFIPRSHHTLRSQYCVTAASTKAMQFK